MSYTYIYITYLIILAEFYFILLYVPIYILTFFDFFFFFNIYKKISRQIVDYFF